MKAFFKTILLLLLTFCFISCKREKIKNSSNSCNVDSIVIKFYNSSLSPDKAFHSTIVLHKNQSKYFILTEYNDDQPIDRTEGNITNDYWQKICNISPNEYTFNQENDGETIEIQFYKAGNMNSYYPLNNASLDKRILELFR